MLDVAHAYTTKDLNSRYNYIEDGATKSLIDMLAHLTTLRSFSLGITAMSPESIDNIKPVVRASNLFYYSGTSIRIAPHNRTTLKSSGIHDTLETN